MNHPTKKTVILCVDDESIILDALQDQLLNVFGNTYQIETSESGNDALEFFKELMDDGYEVPVVIADYIMPGLKGDDLLAEIHIISPDTLNILLTGQANIEGVTKAVNRADLYRYIGKPWEQEDLALTIREAMKSYEQAKEIKIKNKELAELNASLEKKVEQRTRELQELNATKDKFFSIIAHDLKNPFNALIGFSSYLVESYDETPDDQKLNFLKTMHEAAESGYKLLENLLEWSRAQTGRISWNPEEVFISAIISETKELLQKSAQNKKIEIHTTVGDDVKAFADENMVKTIIRNLLSNAIKYTPEGGIIRIDSEGINGMIQLNVIDNGVGIKEEDIPRLFNIGEDFSTNGTNEEQGSGLGLILCKEFAEKNGGKIWVKSEVGKGTSFSFTLPLANNK